MKKATSSLITVLVVLVVLGGSFLIINWKNSSVVEDIPSEEVARWIGEHSVLYVQAGCSHCREQEDSFGANVKYLHIIDCASAKELIDSWKPGSNIGDYVQSVIIEAVKP